ncbi:ABC transporter substrate-binding protein [Streptomyces sp. CMB-StM0423]|uniref:ABC transporter substrate-binding protein n=1 Tax=Streptomyces sp. CMB-StM0423 TaxID=2059884 RepID=UPI000C703B53|nr:ABC transporter substrate-binding protein [Streptomyces sp. CMB-StM0423]AUH38947.1 ABC transporter substrate-binding protein [Streptomyces sp. CMB-StM0423]
MLIRDSRHRPRPDVAHPTRRGLLAAGGALGLGAVLAACGDDSGSGGPDSGAAGGTWRFEDDRGEVAKAGRTPERIVGYVASAAALHDFGIECTGVFGPTTTPDGERDLQAGDLDVAGLTVLGNSYGQFNVEKYASLQPELLVTNMQEPPVLWYVPEESTEEITSLAPAVGIRTSGTSLKAAIGRYAELAAALGADLQAEKVVRAESRFEQASQTLAKTAEDRRGLKVLAVSASTEMLYAAVARDFGDLRYYEELGVEFVTLDNAGDRGFWEESSWETAGRYRADVVMVDRRTGNLQPHQLAESKPTWRRLPAVAAGQVIPWQSEAHHSYAGHAPLMEALADALRDAKQVVR